MDRNLRLQATIYITVGSGVYRTDGFCHEVNSIAQSNNIMNTFSKYEIGLGSSNILNNDYVFRYADVLMMKAECPLRTGRADDAAAIVTQVRTRAFGCT